MKITEVEPIRISIPFEDGGTGEGLTPTRWNALEMCLVRIATDAGLVGWGEGFGYFCSGAVADVVTRMIAPVLVGETLDEPERLNDLMQRRLALFGRYGITMFAISGADIALWDLKAKAEGVPLAALLGGRGRDAAPAYAALVRYGEADLAARIVREAAREGFDKIKLHETTLEAIKACHAAAGGARLIVDVNCAWSLPEAAALVPELMALDVLWLEEPVFPPEDYAALIALGHLGLPIATGENYCTSHQFGELTAGRGVKVHLQPSVTKVGGVTEFARVAALAARAGLALMPHSPYFGPGFLATLQLASAEARIGLVEHLYVRPAAWLYADHPRPEGGTITIPEGPGLGLEPDPDVLARYRVR
ncbi:MAG: mandelate racemase/muconate lactonizing enzyme family protein [Alphaproteobacteria bacterium]|nr:mandelate racemase/muconate lactonizing enzyme family protein [Alphaproteobacteria bacterium]